MSICLHVYNEGDWKYYNVNIITAFLHKSSLVIRICM